MRISLFLAAILCGLAATAQFPYSPLPFKQADFKKIKELGYTRLLVYKQNEEEKEVSAKVEYGKNGLIAAVYERGVNDDGDSINTSETYYKFDGKGKLIQEEGSGESGEWITAYTYDAAGKLIMKQTATIDPPTYKYKYDAKGRLMEVNVTQKMAQHEEDGEWKGKTFERPSDKYKYRYDSKGRLSEEWIWYLPMETKTDPPVYKMIWTYNDKNQVVQVKRVNSDGQVMNSQTYEYDKDGLISKAIYNDGDADTVFFYDYCKGCKQSWMTEEGK
jgi:YD repeat-containing protein